jgi:geranylgeranyl pyrophosphate synthase
VGEGTAEQFLTEVEQLLQDLIARRSGVVCDAAAQSVTAGGKRLRPLLVWAARPANVRADDPVWRRGAVGAAAAVELVHTATLIHDDVLDGALHRRGKPTVVAAHGTDAAVAAGDLLFALAFTALVELREPCGDAMALDMVTRLAAAARSLAEGEALQDAQCRDATLTEADYARRCGGKTGVLFGAALALGAVAGSGERTDIDALHDFGTDVGIAFQIADDILDLADAAAAPALGKQPGADLRDGTITLPMIHALRSDPALAEVLSKPISEGRVAAVAAGIRATGACEQAREDAVTLVASARTRAAQRLRDRYNLPALDLVADQAVHRLS